MALTISSPGVEIREIDLTLNASLPTGTKVLVHGFASQGPAQALLNITSQAELDEIYFGNNGPTNPAETYFYNNCKEILNSPATLLTTRLPYGSGDGTGFQGDYVALCYPASGFNTTTTYNSSLSVFETARIYTSDFTTGSGIEIGQPTMVALTEENYESLRIGELGWNNTLNLSATGLDVISNAAFVVVNDSKMVVNDKYEGYYMAIADNSTIAASGFAAITGVKTLKDSSFILKDLSTNLLNFALTGDQPSSQVNISEIVETSYSYDFTDAVYDNALVMYLFRLKTSMYSQDPNKLNFSGVEKYVGKFDSLATISKSGGGTDSFYLQDIVNNGSNYVQMFVNPYISKKATINTVRTDFTTLNPVGNYTPCKTTDDSLKYIGALDTKIEKALGLAENVLNLDVDIVIDAGLSTIFAYCKDPIKGRATFDDTMSVADGMEALIDVETGDASDFAVDHKLIFNKYNNFCQNTRKDCMFISDPIRGVFVQGENTKTLDRKSRNFSLNIYNPMINLYDTANSNYAATYANWVQVYNSNTQKYIWVPMSGFQAAIMARMDATYYPWYAPFGLNNGIIRNITNIAFRPNQKQMDALYKKGINPVAFFQGDGFVVWGQKTTQTKPSAFDRINVRRLFLVLERSTMKVMRYYIGEPNTVFTRTRVVNTLDPIFKFSQNNSGIYDYRLICSEKNNKADVIDNNQMNVDIYLKPVKTAEYILVTFYAVPTGADFTEYTG